MKKYLALSVAFLLVLSMGVGLASAKPASPPAKNNGLQPLDYTPVYYHTDLVKGTEVVNDDWWSGYSDDGILYDTSDLKKSPNGQTVHDILAFYQGRFLKRDYVKPYVLVRKGDGLYKSKGELVNYQFNEEYGGAKRRAVVTTWLKLDEDGQFKWMVYRADYYTRGKGKMEYINSRVYTVWNDDLDANWNVAGDWKIEVDYKGSKYYHDWTLDSSFDGTGTTGSHTETITGDVSGNQVSFTSVYNNGYQWSGEGTIASDGTMSGTWTSSAGQGGTWESTKGKAKGPLVPDEIYGTLEDLIQAGPANVGGQRP